ncbi:MAG: SDR family oxidoreductase [Acidimicrobiales bacterium]
MVPEKKMAAFPLAVVAGGGSGIGRALCLELARSRRAVAVLDRDFDAASRVASSLGDLFGVPIAAFECDVRNPDKLSRTFDEAERTFGLLETVVAVAGVATSGNLLDSDPGTWREVFEVNVLGAMHVAKAALVRMAERGKGEILLISSVSAVETYTGEPIYMSSKWAQLAFYRCLRKEAVTHGIRVTVILPGLVDTPMSRANPGANGFFAKIPQALRPYDVARTAVWALEQPPWVDVNEIIVRPTGQEL